MCDRIHLKIFIESILCAGHISMCWGLPVNKTNMYPYPWGVYTLALGIKTTHFKKQGW